MKLSWLPDSYMAAVAITDDPDNSSFSKFKTMYDFLMDIEFPTTRAMWVYPKAEFTGTPPLEIDFKAPLLSEPQCLEYCQKLKSKGFEICLHGASCGNNNRDRTLSALNFLAENIEPSKVFICHSKNAENPYWDAKTANLPIEKKVLQLYTKNRCFGEEPDSKYFWGDICREKINFIRLFRTRSVNTLAFNPSMPYHDFTKPFVNYWFSATKGYIPHLFSEQNMEQLCKQNGASILYQYMHRYVNDDDRTICKEAGDVMKRVAGDSRILKRPVSFILNRLKAFQNILITQYQDCIYLINTAEKPLESVKVNLESTDSFFSETPFNMDKIKNEVIFPLIEPLSFVRFRTSDKILKNKLHMKVHGDFGIIRLHNATVYINLTGNEKFLNLNKSMFKIKARCIFVDFINPDSERLRILREISLREIYKLKAGQFSILLREHLFLGRKLSTRNYLNDPGKVENMSNW